jgi:hypothetical protein
MRLAPSRVALGMGSAWPSLERVLSGAEYNLREVNPKYVRRYQRISSSDYQLNSAE